MITPVTETLEISDLSFADGTVFEVTYQWHADSWNCVTKDEINLIGLTSTDPEDGEELNLDNLLKLQIKELNEELIFKCLGDATKKHAETETVGEYYE